MPIHWREALTQHGTVMVYSDPVTTQEWDVAFAEIMALQRWETTPCRLLIDRRRVTAAATGDFVRHVTQALKSHRAQLNHARVAIVAPEDSAFGMARMTELLNDDPTLPYDVRAFRSYEDAETWLAGGPTVA